MGLNNGGLTGNSTGGSGPGTGVTSFKGRTGAVSPTTGDYTIAQITNGLSNALASTKIFVGSVGGLAVGVALTLNAVAGAFSLANDGTLTMPDASASVRGLLEPSDFSSFAAKQAALSGTGLVKSTAGTISYVNGTSGQFVKGDGSLDSTTYESLANKATNFSTLNNTLYPTTQAVSNYVGAAIDGLSWKTHVTIASTGNVTLSGEQTIDGFTTSNTRILLKNQTNQTENGVYITASGAWTRSSDMDASSEFPSAAMLVDQGSVNAGSRWVCSNPTVVLGTTNITFVQFANGSTYTNGAGLTLTGNIFAVDAAHVPYFAALTTGFVRWSGSAWTLDASTVVNSVSNIDGTLTVSPTSGAVVASLNLGNANNWTAVQNFGGTINGSGTSALTGMSVTSTLNPAAGQVNSHLINFTGTLVASANNQVLTGVYVAPTFTNGAFTGVTNNLINLANKFKVNAAGTVNVANFTVAGIVANDASGNLSSTTLPAAFGTQLPNLGWFSPLPGLNDVNTAVPSFRAMDNTDLPYSNQYKVPIWGGTVYAFGDSFTQSQQATNVNYGYINIFAGKNNVTISNLSISARGAFAAAQQAVANIVNPSNFECTTLFGFNDVRRNGAATSTLNKINCGINTVALTSWTQFAIAASAVVNTGTWANYTTITTRSASKLSGNARSSSTAGNTLSYTTTTASTNIIVGCFGSDGTTANYGRFTVTIDSLVVGTYTNNGNSDGISDGVNNNAVINNVIVFDALANQVHTVVITLLDNLLTPIDYIGFLKPPSECQGIFVLSIPRMNAAGYAITPANANDSVIDTATITMENNCNNLSAFGRSCSFGNLNRYYITTTMVGADSIHPNDPGYAGIEQCLQSLIQSSVNYKSELSYFYPNNANGGSSAGFLGQFYDGSATDATSLSVNRNPNTGAFYNTSKAGAQFSLISLNGDSSLVGYTSATNNSAPTAAITIDKNGLITANKSGITANGVISGNNNLTLTGATDKFISMVSVNSAITYIGTVGLSSSFVINRVPTTGSFPSSSFPASAVTLNIANNDASVDIYTSNTNNSITLSQRFDKSGNILNGTIISPTSLAKGFVLVTGTAASADVSGGGISAWTQLRNSVANSYAFTLRVGASTLATNHIFGDRVGFNTLLPNASVHNNGSSAFANLVSSASTLTYDLTFTQMVFSGTTATHTLPAIATGTTSLWYKVYNRGSGNLTMQITATPTTLYYNGAAVSSVVIPAGGYGYFYCDGTYWLATLNGSSGAGTVTTFSSGSLSPLFTTSVSNASTTPALSYSLSNAASTSVFGNFTNSSAAPSYNQAPSDNLFLVRRSGILGFGALVGSDIPTGAPYIPLAGSSSISGDLISTSTNWKVGNNSANNYIGYVTAGSQQQINAYSVAGSFNASFYTLANASTSVSSMTASDGTNNRSLNINPTVMSFNGGIVVYDQDYSASILASTYGLVSFNVTERRYIGYVWSNNGSVTISNTVTETSLFSAGSSSDRTLTANSIVTGQVISIKGGGLYSTPVGTPSFTIKIKIGSVVVAQVVTTALVSGASGNAFEFEEEIVCYSTGGTGAFATCGNINYSIGSGSRIFNDLNNAGATASVDTTISNVVDVTITWDAATSSRSLLTLDANIQILRKA